MLISTNQALAILKQDSMRNISIINYLDSHPDARIQQFGESLLVRKEGVVYISSQDPSELRTIIANLDSSDTFFASVQEWIAMTIKGERKVKWFLHMPRYVLPLDIPLPEQVHLVQTLGPEHADMVAKSWLYNDGNLEYAMACLKRGPAAGVFVGGEPVAWAGVHEDGALGFLNTKEEHRGRGYAQSITLYLIKHQRAQGRVSFVNIEEGKKSLGLALKLGFIPGGSTCWVEL